MDMTNDFQSTVLWDYCMSQVRLYQLYYDMFQIPWAAMDVNDLLKHCMINVITGAAIAQFFMAEFCNVDYAAYEPGEALPYSKVCYVML